MRGLLIAILCVATPAAAQDWTPRTAAALLDDKFPSAKACQDALADAQRRESRAAPVHGLSYSHLFEQARCDRVVHKGVASWHVRMHWKPRQRVRAPTGKTASARQMTGVQQRISGGAPTATAEAPKHRPIQ